MVNAFGEKDETKIGQKNKVSEGILKKNGFFVDIYEDLYYLNALKKNS